VVLSCLSSQSMRSRSLLFFLAIQISLSITS
jgi:hypothetical protein